MIALKSRLQKYTFLFSLKKKNPKNFVKMMTWVEKYAEEGYDAHPALSSRQKLNRRWETPGKPLPIELTEETDKDPLALHLVSDPDPYNRTGRTNPHLRGTNLFP